MKTLDDLSSKDLLLIRRQLASGTIKMSLVAKLNGISMTTVRKILKSGNHR